MSDPQPARLDGPRPPARRVVGWLAPLLVAVLAALAAYAPALAPQRQLAGRDLLTLYYPLFQHVAQAWHGEASFQRDPLRGLGQPIYPDPLAQVTYPPAAALWIGVPFPLAFKLYFLLHTALLGLGAAALARALGASTRGACLAAVAATLAGPTLSACRTPNLLAAAAWSGFALAGFVHAQRAGRAGRRAAVGAAFACALMILAGGATYLILLALLVGVAVPVGAGRPRAVLRGYAVIGAAACLGVALAAVHLVPFKLWFPETVRGQIAAQGSIPLAEATQWSLHPLRLLEVLVPGLSPHTLAASRPGWYEPVYASFQPYGKPLHASVHLGLPVVVLAGLGARRSRWAAGFAVGGLLWLLIALRIGGHTPGWELLRELAPPLFGAWRYPGKTLLPLAVVVAALAGVGLSRLPAPRRVGVCVLSLLLLIAAPTIDADVIPTLPQSVYVSRPQPAAAILAAEAERDGPPARYLRLVRIETAPTDDFAMIRHAHLSELRENLNALWGIPAYLSYGPFANHRLDAYLMRHRRPAPEFFDREALRTDACVGWILSADGLHDAPPPPRAQRVGGRGWLRLARADPERIEVEVELESPGELYLAEVFDPAWQAHTEPLHPAARAAEGGPQPLALHEARGLGIGAALPAGTYRVVLRYRTRGVWRGIGISLVALLVAGVVWLWRGSRLRA